MSPADLTEFSNQAKEVFLDTMVSEKILTDEQIAVMNKYCIVVAEKTFFGKLWEKLIWSDVDSTKAKIMVVKLID
jgi:hypothetical protein